MDRLTRTDFERLDQQDALAEVRQQFHLPEGVIYLDGNSLGPLPRQAALRAREVIEQEWGRDLIRSWNDHGWVDLPTRVGDKLAPLIGAQAGEVLVCDSTSVNLYKLAAAALRLDRNRRRIVSEQGNFPTDLYMLEGVTEFSDTAVDLVTVPRAGVRDAIDDDTALVVLTHVHYKTGELWDLEALTRTAHRNGALILWDLSHSTGAVPVDLALAGADLAVGCGYKYLNGGPGAPAYLYIAHRLQDRLQNPLAGWFGHAEPFAFEENYRPADDLRRMLSGTPPVLATTLLEVGIDLLRGVDLAAVRSKSLQLGDLFIRLMAQHCPQFECVSPRQPGRRGSQVSFRHKQGYAIVQALIEQGVIGDFRAPDILRFGLAPLYTRYVDIHDAVQLLAGIMESGSWDREDLRQQSAVT